MNGRTPLVIYTIGHSTHAIKEFVRILRGHGVRRLIDVRTIPKSRHNPQFNQGDLRRSLRNRRIHYRHIKALGGLRRARRDSMNMGWRNDSFRGFADYMQTPEFENAIEELIRIAQEEPAAIMCAEAVPWRCHRSLIADALTTRGIEVRHILSEKKWSAHKLTPFARVSGERVTYPQASTGESGEAGRP